MIEATAPREASVLAPTPEPATPPASGSAKDMQPFGSDGLTFFDLLDVINPLQHIPIISTIYRKLTGDEISPAARVAGATLFGGPIGTAWALVDTAVEHKTGRDIGANAMAAFFPDEDAPSGTGAEFARAASGSGPGTAAVHGFAPRVTDPIQLVPGGAAAKPFVASAAPDLQALAAIETAAGHPATATGAPIKLEPRHAIAPWSAPEAAPEPASASIAAESEPAVTRSAISRTWARPAQDMPKGATASLSRQAMRAYAASANAAPTPAPVKALEIDTAAARNDWILEAMLRAHDKYAEAHRLQGSSAAPAAAAISR